jgi:hypothetical protein
MDRAGIYCWPRARLPSVGFSPLKNLLLRQAGEILDITDPALLSEQFSQRRASGEAPVSLLEGSINT